MESTDHVEFSGAGADAFFGALPDFIEREIVGAWGVRVASEGAEFAMGYADIGRIDVAIDVEVADVTVARFADVVGEPAYGKEVGRTIEHDAVSGSEADSGENLFGDGLQARVSDLEFCHILFLISFSLSTIIHNH